MRVTVRFKLRQLHPQESSRVPNETRCNPDVLLVRRTDKPVALLGTEPWAHSPWPGTFLIAISVLI